MNRFLKPPSLNIIGLSGLASSLAALLVGLPARSEVPLTRADVESLYNQVEFISEGQDTRPANLDDWLAVGDAVRTALGARAELRFNDGSLARVGEQATFWFVPNTRDFRLSNGTALFLIPPNQGPSNIRTPSAVTGIQGTALVVRHIPRVGCDASLLPAGELACPGRTVVMVLTDSPKGPVRVTTDNGNSATLSAGDLAVIENNVIQTLEFNLQLFYETSPLVDGLDLDNPDFEGTGSPTDPVRQETWDGIQSQESFEGSYLLNPELIRVDAQLGISTSWLLTAADANDALLVDSSNTTRISDIASVGSQTPGRNSATRALMSSWLTNTLSTLTPPQASVPGIVMPNGLGEQPVRTMRPTAVGSAPNPAVPAATRPPLVGRPGNGGSPSAPSQPVVSRPTLPPVTQPPTDGPANPAPPVGGGTAVPPTQPADNPNGPANPGAPIGGGADPVVPEPPNGDPGGPVTPEPPSGNPGGPVTPEPPFNPGGGEPPAPPTPVEPPVVPPVDTFNPPGNPNPTGDPNFTPPGNPSQPQGLPFNPGGGGAEPAPAPDTTGNGLGNIPTTPPVTEVNTNSFLLESVPQVTEPNNILGSVLTELADDGGL